MQLLVYAAGLEAHTVVWVAREVTGEYQKVIDWLNQETSPDFWALEIELWRIEGSPVAPKFNIVCEPNKLTKTTAGDTQELSGIGLTQLEFWKGFSEYLDESDSSFNARKAAPQNWYHLPIGTARAYISCTVLVNSGRLGCELYLPGRFGATAIFEALQQDKDALEAELGELDWQDLPDAKACRIADYKHALNIEDREQWPELFEWLKDRAEAFKRGFGQRVKDIDLPDSQDGSGGTHRVGAEQEPWDESGPPATAAGES